MRTAGQETARSHEATGPFVSQVGQDEVLVPGCKSFDDPASWHRPDLLVEDLDLDRAGVACLADLLGDGREVDVPVPGESARIQGLGGQGQDPVADLVAGNASLPAGTGD